MHTDKVMPTVLYELFEADTWICRSAACLRRVFDDCVLLFQKVKIFKALLLFSAGHPGGSCWNTLGFVFLYERRGRSNPPDWNVFTGGRHSVDTIILLFCPFVLESGERVNPFGWDVSSPVFDADQISFLAGFCVICVCLTDCAWLCIVTEKAAHQLGFRSDAVSPTPL